MANLRPWHRFILLAALAAIACAGPSATAPRGSGPTLSSEGGSAAAQGQRKVLTIALPSEINALATSLNQAGINSQSSRYAREFMNTYVTTTDQEGKPHASLAVELPTLDNGLWQLNSDGSMDVTWKLRGDVRWHDGRPFTSDDVKFGWEAERDAATLLNRAAGRIGGVATPDELTAALHWNAPASDAGEFTFAQLDPLPRWILGEALEGDKSALGTHPYFNEATEFVGLGPFRTVEWIHGATLTLDAWDGYFLGRPKDRPRDLPDHR